MRGVERTADPFSFDADIEPVITTPTDEAHQYGKSLLISNISKKERMARIMHMKATPIVPAARSWATALPDLFICISSLERKIIIRVMI